MVVSVLLFLNMVSYQFRFFSVVQSHQSYYFEVYSPFLLCLIMLILLCSFNLTVRLFSTKLIAAV